MNSRPQQPPRKRLLPYGNSRPGGFRLNPDRSADAWQHHVHAIAAAAEARAAAAARRAADRARRWALLAVFCSVLAAAVDLLKVLLW